MLVFHLAGVLHARCFQHEGQARGDVAQALDQQVLDHLVSSNGFAELDTFLGVGQGSLIGANGNTDRCPRNLGTGEAKHGGGVRKAVGILQAVRFRHTNIRQGDVGVLNNSKRLLALDFGCDITLGVGRNNEALDLTICSVLSPDHTDICPRGISNPALRSVKNPVVPVTGGSGAKALCRIRTRKRFGQTKGTHNFT